MLIATEPGRSAFERLAETYRTRLERFAERWAHEDRAEVTERLSVLSRALIAELPVVSQSS